LCFSIVIVEIAEKRRPELVETAAGNRQAKETAQQKFLTIQLDEGVAARGVGDDGDGAAHLHSADLYPCFRVTVDGG
jgi:hypothetical protein